MILSIEKWMFKWVKRSVLNNIEYNVIHNDFEKRKKDEKKWNIYDEKWNKYQHIKIPSAISKYLRECRNLNIACERVIVCYVNMFDAWMWEKKRKHSIDWWRNSIDRAMNT
jgi:hypothetical protein